MPPGVIVTPPSQIRASIKTQVDAALADIPPEKTGALVAVSTPVGVNLAVAARLRTGWTIAAWVGKNWRGPAVDFGTQVTKTW